MFYVEDQVIYLTRGDTATLAVTLATENGEEYTVGADDILTLTVRKEPKAESTVIFRRSVTGKQEIDILPEDTRDAEIGQYSADAQITTATGDVFTVFPRLEGSARYKTKNYKNFVIMPEVTIDGQ